MSLSWLHSQKVVRLHCAREKVIHWDLKNFFDMLGGYCVFQNLYSKAINYLKMVMTKKFIKYKGILIGCYHDNGSLQSARLSIVL